VDDPQVLERLERKGYALGDLLGGEGGATNRLHETSVAYSDMVKLLSLDQDLLAARDPESGVGFGNLHRAFDVGWLRAEGARFELVAVVNRLDRKHVRPGGCGERRLVYRLAYAKGSAKSRLPMTLNLVLEQNPGPNESGCQGVAKRWMAVDHAAATETALRESVLAPPFRVLRVETNIQSVRYPSGVRPGLGGHAAYVLRVFPMKNGRLSVGSLENTPTVTLDGAGRRMLRKFVRENLSAVEDGTLVLPEHFLARRSVSVAPRGLLRSANRPYRKVLGAPRTLFRGINLRRFTGLKSPKGAMRRLESMTCKGCHQSNSLAGFHLLGRERDPDERWNAMAVGLSPHLVGALDWRQQFLKREAEGTVAPPRRPFAERTSGGGSRAACGLGDPAFKGWTCDPGLTCRNRLGDDVGTCGPAAPLPPGAGTELSTLVLGHGKKADRVRTRKRLPCAPFGLQKKGERGAKSSNGFPGGMCHAPCSVYGERKDEAVCGPIPFHGGKLFGGFTKCLASGKATFSKCAAASSQPTWLARCDLSTPCRKDYLCSRVPNLPADQGACVPTYFLAQLRVDGHALSGTKGGER